MTNSNSGYTGKFHAASVEVFSAVFGPYVNAAQVLADAADADRTPQDYIREHVEEAVKQGLETDADEAFDCCCEECDVPAM
jgi:hypothetical protein